MPVKTTAKTVVHISEGFEIPSEITLTDLIGIYILRQLIKRTQILIHVPVWEDVTLVKNNKIHICMKESMGV